MIKKIAAAFASALLIATGLSTLSASASDPQLDQVVVASDSTYNLNINFDERVYQTFTPGVSGNLTAIKMQVAKLDDSIVNPFTIAIFPVDGNLAPNLDMAIAQQTLSYGQVASMAVFDETIQTPDIELSFSRPAYLESGTRYAIVAFSRFEDASNFRWPINTSADYEGGSRFRKFGDPGDGDEVWSPSSSVSVGFSTFMQDAPAPELPLVFEPASDSLNPDQSEPTNLNNPSSFWNSGFGGGSTIFQSFTPAKNGFLTTVDIPLFKSDYPVETNHPFVFSIIAADESGAFNPDDVLAATLVQAVDVDVNASMVTIRFEHPAYLEIGTKYLMEAKSEWVGGWGNYQWLRTISSTYDRGNYCDFDYSTGQCVERDFSMGFTTYMVPGRNPNASYATPAIDQNASTLSQTESARIVINDWALQTFTPSVSGWLTKIDVALSADDVRTTNVKLELFTIDEDGLPVTDEYLGARTIAGSEIPGILPGEQAWTMTEFEFSNPTYVESGQKYAFRLSDEGSGNGDASVWIQYASAEYSGGELMFDDGENLTWDPQDGGDPVFVDAAFRTFVSRGIPAVVGELDQIQTVSAVANTADISCCDWSSIGNANKLIWTFTPALTGRLTTVGLPLATDDNDPSNLPLTLQVVALNQDGQPLTSSPLSEVTVPSEVIRSNYNQINFVFENPALLAAGTVYALVAFSDNGTGDSWHRIAYKNRQDEAYARGQECQRVEDSQEYLPCIAPFVNNVPGFQTYMVAVSQPAQSQSPTPSPGPSETSTPSPSPSSNPTPEPSASSNPLPTAAPTEAPTESPAPTTTSNPIPSPSSTPSPSTPESTKPTPTVDPQPIETVTFDSEKNTTEPLETAEVIEQVSETAAEETSEQEVSALPTKDQVDPAVASQGLQWWQIGAVLAPLAFIGVLLQSVRRRLKR